MKAYAVVGKWDYEGDDAQGVWTTLQEASRWMDALVQSRMDDELDGLPWDSLTLWEVEGTSWRRVRELDRNANEVE